MSVDVLAIRVRIHSPGEVFASCSCVEFAGLSLDLLRPSSVSCNSNHNSNEAYYLGSLDNVITVASTVGNGSHAPFSNPSDWIDISAPCTEILSTGNFRDGQSTYVSLSGNSMAVPQVAGILALGWSL